MWYGVRVRDECLMSFSISCDVRLTVCGGSERQEYVCRPSAFKSSSSATRLRRNPSLATSSSRTSTMSRETTVVGDIEGSCGQRSSSVAFTNRRTSAIRRETTVGGVGESAGVQRSSSLSSAAANNRISAIRRKTTVGGDREFREGREEAAEDVGVQGAKAVAEVEAAGGRRRRAAC